MQQHGDSRVIHPYTGLGGLCIRARKAPSSPPRARSRARAHALHTHAHLRAPQPRACPHRCAAAAAPFPVAGPFPWLPDFEGRRREGGCAASRRGRQESLPCLGLGRLVCHLKPCAIYRLCRLSPSARGRRPVVRGSKTFGFWPAGHPCPPFDGGSPCQVPKPTRWGAASQVAKLRLWLEDHTQSIRFAVYYTLRDAHRRLTANLARAADAADTEEARRAASLEVCKARGLLRAQVYEVNDALESPLTSAAADGAAPADIRLLIAAGSAVNEPEGGPSVAVMNAAMYGQVEVLATLLEAKAAVNAADEKKRKHPWSQSKTKVQNCYSIIC